MITATIGLVPGYQNGSEPIWEVIDLVLQQMAEEMPFTYSFKRVLYKKDWGCPLGGEWVVEISAMRNNHFEPNYYEWLKKWHVVIAKYSKMLRQKTAQAYSSEGNDFIYIKNTDEEISTIRRPYIFDDPGNKTVSWLNDEEYKSTLIQRRMHGL